MKLICDLCGCALTETAGAHTAVCSNCGIEYGADRLQEMREAAQAATPVTPVAPKPTPIPEPKPAPTPIPEPKPAPKPAPKKNAEQTKQTPPKSGRQTALRILCIVGLLDLLFGVKIVALFCAIIAVCILLFSKPAKK